MNATAFVLSLALVMGTGCENSGSANEQSADKSDRSSSSNGSTSARDLIPYIRAVQKAHVRESTGIYAYQCFTDLDLGRFKDNSVHLKVAREAKRSARFRGIVAQLKILPDEQRRVVLAEARNVAHPTWAQLGRITTDGSGQTEAGQAAEGLIAGAIVGAAEEMMAWSDR